MKKMFQEFKKFIKRGNVVDMAIGVAVATAFTAIVNSFTKGIISPLIALLTGESTLAELKWVLRPAELAADGTEIKAEVAMMPGLVIQAAIDFLIVAIFLFIVMHVAHKLSERAKRIFDTNLIGKKVGHCLAQRQNNRIYILKKLLLRQSLSKRIYGNKCGKGNIIGAKLVCGRGHRIKTSLSFDLAPKAKAFAERKRIL